MNHSFDPAQSTTRMEGSGPQILLAGDSYGGSTQGYGSFSHGGHHGGDRGAPWASAASGSHHDAGGDAGGAPIKLFFGQIPRHLSDLEVREVFDQFGIIRDFVVLKFKDTGLSKGAFGE